MRRVPGVLAVLSVLLAGPGSAVAAQAPETVVAQLAKPSPVSAVPGAALYSDYDAATQRYRLVVREVGGLPLTLPFAPQAEPFDADLGTDTDGRAAVAAAVGGDLFVLTIDRDSAPRPVRNANTGDEEHAPTLDEGRLAFARTYRAPTGDVVYTKRLTTPRATPSTRLPGVPSQRCLRGDAPNSPCGTFRRTVRRLDLLDGQLAQHVSYRTGLAGGVAQQEVRWVTLQTRAARQVAYVASGESGQGFLGAQWAGSRLSWYRGCERACPEDYTAAFRYRTGVGYDVDPAPPGGLSGFAGTGDGTWQVRGAYLTTCGGEEPAVTPCTLVRTREPRWERIAASRVRL